VKRFTSCYADSNYTYNTAISSFFFCILSARKAEGPYLNLFQKQREVLRSVMTSIWELSTQISTENWFRSRRTNATTITRTLALWLGNRRRASRNQRARQRAKLKFAFSNNRSSVLVLSLSFPLQLLYHVCFWVFRLGSRPVTNVQFDSETSRGWHSTFLLFGETCETWAG